MQVLLAGAYRAPREINWWFGLVLLFVTLGFSLTGYLLPWDQKGYWATKVATNIAGGAPVLGPVVQKVIVGGTEYGNQTLTRFYGLHVGLFPMLLVACLAAHVALFRKQGVTAPQSRRPTETFWPKQVFMDTLASAVVLGVIVGLVGYYHGADLDAPADPSRSTGDYPARPEWYFLSLFQMLKLFPGKLEVVGTIVVPTAILIVLFCLPLFDKVLPRKFAHFLACTVVFALMGGASYLTFAALRADATDWQFQADRHRADEARERALRLADSGLPPAGPARLLTHDPLFHGRRVLEAKCLSCHYYDGQGVSTTVISTVSAQERAGVTEPLSGVGAPEPVLRALAAKSKGFRAESVHSAPGHGEALVYSFKGRDGQGNLVEAAVSADASKVEVVTQSKQAASDLNGFGTREWVRGLLADPGAPAYFKNVRQCREMKAWRKKTKLTPRELGQVANLVVDVLAKAPLSRTLEEIEADETASKHLGLASFKKECATCHELGAGGTAPNLSGWGSVAWINHMIDNPGADDLYAFLEADEQMPAFHDQLTATDIDMVIRYLRGEYPGAPLRTGGGTRPVSSQASRQDPPAHLASSQFRERK
jgi:mono/diheme cytochrome c family protein